jgi:hypothetical protein
VVGALLAASTGVVGASVVAMGVISLPVMLKYNYDKRLATGTISAAGTLGQIIPPSIILIILGDVFQAPVGDLFKAALWPGLSLVVFYIAYIVIITMIKKDLAPPIRLEQAAGSKTQQVFHALVAVIPPLILIVLVLGSILTGVATPTESSSVGGIGAILLAALYGRFSVRMVWESSLETVKITAMVFAILIGASGRGMGVPDPVNAGHHGTGFLHRFRRDFLHCRADPRAHSCQPGHRPDLVRHPDCNESTDFIPDTAVRLQPFLSQRRCTARSPDHRHLLWRGSFYRSADGRASHPRRLPSVVRIFRALTAFRGHTQTPQATSTTSYTYLFEIVMGYPRRPAWRKRQAGCCVWE